MKIFSIPEFQSEFEVKKDLKLEVYFLSSEKNVMELKKGSRLVFTDVSTRFSSILELKGYKFKKLSTKESKGSVVFIVPFENIDKLLIKPVEKTLYSSVKKPVKDKIKNFRIFGRILNPNDLGIPIEHVHYEEFKLPVGTKKDVTIEANTNFHYKNNFYTVEITCTMEAERLSRNIIHGTGFEARPVKKELLFLRNPRVKILGKTFELKTKYPFGGNPDKELGDFLINMVNKGIITEK